MPFTDLPAELLACIVEYLGFKSSAYLLPLALSCKLLNTFAEAFIYQEYFCEWCFTSKCFLSSLLARPSRAEHLRKLVFGASWLINPYHVGRPWTQEENKNYTAIYKNAALALSLSSNLRSLKIYHAKSFNTHHRLFAAVSQLKALTTLHLCNLERHPTIDLRFLCYIESPVQDFSLEKFGELPFHVFDMIGNYQATLRVITLCEGTVHGLKGDTRSWPRVRSLTMRIKQVNMPTLEAAFPNVETLTVFPPVDCCNADSTPHHVTFWKKLKIIVTARGCFLSHHLRGCSAERLGLYALNNHPEELRNILCHFSPSMLRLEFDVSHCEDIAAMIAACASEIHLLDLTLLRAGVDVRNLSSPSARLRQMALKIPSLQLLRISLCATFRPDSDFEEDPGADAVFDFVVGLMHELPTLTLLRIKGSKKHWNYAARRSLNVTEGAGHVGNRVQLLTGSDADRVDHIFEAFWSMQ